MEVPIINFVKTLGAAGAPILDVIRARCREQEFSRVSPCRGGGRRSGGKGLY